MTLSTPVSYTHLDVYKRQQLWRRSDEHGEIFPLPFINAMEKYQEKWDVSMLAEHKQGMFQTKITTGKIKGSVQKRKNKEKQ